MRLLGIATCIFAAALAAVADTFVLPTANRAIYDADGGTSRYYVGTVGRTWQSGTFGCVRSDGQQMHEGLDIKCVRRDKKGEPIDDILAAADAQVAYINSRAHLSNYGNYIILRHSIEGLEIYSLYAHLSAIRSGLKTGQNVKAGETIGTMGRTSNTRQRISQERAHLHFEINLLVNDRFLAWHKKNFPGQRNDHGVWNGRNILALDPRALFLAQKQLGSKFSLKDHIQNQTALCRVLVRDNEFPYVKRYAGLIEPARRSVNATAYELVLNANGIPVKIIPRSAAESGKGTRFQLLAVNPTEFNRSPCRKLIRQRNGRWEIAPAGMELLDLLTY